jgi:hypothetical protein
VIVLLSLHSQNIRTLNLPPGTLPDMIAERLWSL